MTRFWHGLIAAALLSATHSYGLAAEPLDGVLAAARGEHAGQAGLSDRDHLQPMGAGMIQVNAAGVRPGLRESVLASHAVQPLKRLEFGIGLDRDALVQGAAGWYGVYLRALDRVDERSTPYGRLRETRRFGPDDGGTPPAPCCRRNEAPTSLEQFASAISGREVSPTFLYFGMLRKKEWGLDLNEGWKVQAGVRHMQYSSTARTKIGFLTVDRHWENFRAAYSYQLQRSHGASMAPGHVVQLDYLFGPGDSIGLSVAIGREFASFGALGMLNTEARSATIRGQHLFKRDWALTYQAGYNHHGSMPAQSGARFGLRHSF